MKPLIFRIRRGDTLLSVKQVLDLPVTIGRDAGSHVVLDDASVSLLHSMVEKRGENQFALVDLGSQSGTIKDNTKILDTELKSGDLFKIGVFTIEFSVGAALSTQASDQQTAVRERIAPPPPPPPTRKPAVIVPTAAKVATGVDVVPLNSPAVSKQQFPIKTNKAVSENIARLRSRLKPSKGTTVEVIVAWQDQLLNTYHFFQKGIIKAGSHPKNDVIIPVMSGNDVSLPLLKIEGQAQVFVPLGCDGEIVRGQSSQRISDLAIGGQITRNSEGFVISLGQDEMVRVDYDAGVSIFIRFVGASPAPLMLPYLDLTTSELTALIASAVLMVVAGLLIQVVSPETLEEELKKPDEPIRKVKMSVPRKRIELSEETREETPQQGQSPTPDPTKNAQAKGSPMNGPPSPPSEARPNDSQSTKKILTAAQVGKTGSLRPVNSQKNQSSSAASAPKKEIDVSKVGILSAFGGKGAQAEIDKAVSGAEAVGGLGKGAGGKAGLGIGNNSGATEPGLREVGAGGKGTATIGVAGVNTRGRGGGNTGYGEESLGGKKGSQIVSGGSEEAFQGTIDREAIRRVVKANQNQLKSCYERALNRDPSLSGKLVLSWVIGPGGKVLSASVKTSTLANKEVEQCCVSRLTTWRFPEPPTNTEAAVTYPFIFNKD